MQRRDNVSYDELMSRRNENPDLISSPPVLIALLVGVVGLIVITWLLIGDVWARTVGLGVAASAIAIPLGLLIFWAIQNGRWAGRLLLLASIVLAAMPIVVHVSSWDAAIGKLGWLSTARGNVLVPLVSGWWAATWVHGLVAAPQIALMLFVCNFRQGRIYEEQALLDAGSWTIFSRITLWRFAPVILIGVLWVIVGCAREITVVDLYQVETFAEQIYLGYSLGNGSANPVNSISVAPVDVEINYGWQTPLLYVVSLTLVGAIAVFVMADLVRPKLNDVRPQRVRSSFSSAGGVGVSLLLLAMLVVAPIANVVTRASFFVESSGGALIQKYSLTQAWLAVKKSLADYQLEMFWSAMISLAASTVAVIIVLAMIRLSAKSRIRQAIVLMVIAIGLALPGPVIGSWLNGLLADVESELVRYWIDYTIFAPVVANVIFTGPLIAILIWFVLRRTPESVDAAGQLDGATAAARFWHIDFASNWTAVLGCWLFGCVLCFGELAASQMVRPAGMDTVSRKMLGDLHAGVNELTAGATMLVALLAVGLTVVGWSVIKFGAKRA